jgi:hypothetical protein
MAKVSHSLFSGKKIREYFGLGLLFLPSYDRGSGINQGSLSFKI